MARNSDYGRSGQNTGDSETLGTGHSSPPFSKRRKSVMILPEREEVLVRMVAFRRCANKRTYSNHEKG